MSQKSEQLYEGMYIINATLSEKARGEALERIQEDILKKGGEIKLTHEMGRKKFAYEMSGHREGYYYVIYFATLPGKVPEMWQEYRLNEDLIRFITLSTDKVMEEIKFKPLEA